MQYVPVSCRAKTAWWLRVPLPLSRRLHTTVSSSSFFSRRKRYRLIANAMNGDIVSSRVAVISRSSGTSANFNFSNLISASSLRSMRVRNSMVHINAYSVLQHIRLSIANSSGISSGSAFIV